jgi:hypothetical protein
MDVFTAGLKQEVFIQCFLLVRMNILAMTLGNLRLI